jgi:hypothetical protein
VQNEVFARAREIDVAALARDRFQPKISLGRQVAHRLGDMLRRSVARSAIKSDDIVLANRKANVGVGIQNDPKRDQRSD